MRLTDTAYANEAASRDYRADSSSVAAVYVVGSNDTVRALQSYLTQYSAAYLTVFVERAELHSRQARIDNLNNLPHEELQKYTAEIDELMDAQVAGHIRLLETALVAVTEVFGLLPACVFAIRREMDLPIDESDFLADYESAVEKNVSLVSGLIEILRREAEGAGSA
jgi:hypothetical protein